MPRAVCLHPSSSDRLAVIVREKRESETSADFRYLMIAARLAENLVRTHWETIELIAQNVLRLGLVDGSLFTTLVSEHLKRGDFRRTLEAAEF